MHDRLSDEMGQQGVLANHDGDGDGDGDESVTWDKRCNEQNNSYARAFWISVHFFAVLCETTTWNDQVLRISENANRNG